LLGLFGLNELIDAVEVLRGACGNFNAVWHVCGASPQ
jgi:hypothetical protein